MGYTTEFDGAFKLDRPLTPERKAYLNAFSRTRRMKRNATLAAKLPDPIREAVNRFIGVHACYFVGGTGPCGQDHDKSVIDYNSPPLGQPGLWCQWVPNDDGTEITWDGGEKFYRYIEWLKYIIESFIEPWGYTLNGEVTWQGEEPDDFGRILVKDNSILTQKGHRTYG